MPDTGRMPAATTEVWRSRRLALVPVIRPGPAPPVSASSTRRDAPSSPASTVVSGRCTRTAPSRTTPGPGLEAKAGSWTTSGSLARSSGCATGISRRIRPSTATWRRCGRRMSTLPCASRCTAGTPGSSATESPGPGPPPVRSATVPSPAASPAVSPAPITGADRSDRRDRSPARASPDLLAARVRGPGAGSHARLVLPQVEHVAGRIRQRLELAVDPLVEAAVDVEDGVEHPHGQAELAGEGQEPVGVLGQGASGEGSAAPDAVHGVERR